MKLSFKMKVKLGVLVVFVITIALVIREDHAGVVLRKFKPKRLLDKKEANTTIETKSDPRAKNPWIKKNESIIENFSKNETAEKLKTNDVLLLNSSVVYYNSKNEESDKLKTNSKKLLNSSVVYYHKTNDKNITSKSKVSIKDFNRNKTKSNLKMKEVKDENQNLSTLQESEISSAIDATLLNFSEFQKKDHADIKPNHQKTKISNSSVSHAQKEQRSLEFDVDGIVSNNSTEALLNISDSSSLMHTNSKTKELQNSPNNSKDVLPDEKTNNEAKGAEKIKSTSVHPNDKENVSFIPEKIFGSDASPTSSETEIDQKMNSSTEQLNKINFPSNLTGKHSNVSPIAESIDKALNKTEEKLVDLHEKNNQKVDLTNEIDVPDNDIQIKANETVLNETSMGLESIVSAGLDFLANSEVAKNAALAMEIFNLSDSSITDHIVDDPDSVIELVRPSIQEETKDSSTMNVEEEIKDSSKVKIEGGMKVDEEVKDSSIIKTHEEIKDSSLTGIEEEIKNSSMMGDQGEIKDSSTMNESPVEHDINLVDKKEKKCPPPGICVFWFMTRNTCNSDDQCLDSKICCRIRCSKQCISV